MQGQQTIGIVGGGQLGRMLTLAAHTLGFKVIVVDPGDNCPARQVGAQQIQAQLNDKSALRKLSRLADFITIEIEHVDSSLLERTFKNGTPVNPAPSSIQLIQDKYIQKQYLQENDFSVAPFQAVNTFEQAETAFELFDESMLLKTRRNAFDGRGNAHVKTHKQLESAWRRFNGAGLYAEKTVNFSKELAVMVAKDFEGNIKTYPVVETIHQRSICIETQAPAQVSETTRDLAAIIATQAVKTLEGAGMFGVELFLLTGGSIVINEIAPRVHNSGHYTMNACATSQFEQHIRAITGLPLGETHLITPSAVMINILGERNAATEVSGMEKALRQPDTFVHLYGKSPTKVDRKMGHINANGVTIKTARKKAVKARQAMSI